MKRAAPPAAGCGAVVTRTRLVRTQNLSSSAAALRKKSRATPARASYSLRRHLRRFRPSSDCVCRFRLALLVLLYRLICSIIRSGANLHRAAVPATEKIHMRPAARKTAGYENGATYLARAKRAAGEARRGPAPPGSRGRLSDN